MSVTRSEVRERLLSCDVGRLKAVLAAGAVGGSDTDDPQELADRFVKALWWRTHTPVGLAVLRDDLDDLVDRTAHRLDRPLPGGDAWLRLDALTRQLVPGDTPIRLDELPEDVIDRLESANWTTWLGVGTAGGAAGTKVVAEAIVEFLKGPIGDLLPFIPKVGPIAIAIKKGARIAASVAGPVGIAVTLLTINDALGSDYDEAAPLLLGLGLLMRTPEGPAVYDVDAEAPEETPDEADEDVAEEPTASEPAEGAEVAPEAAVDGAELEEVDEVVDEAPVDDQPEAERAVDEASGAEE